MSKAKTFDAISDISQLSGRLRLLGNFSLSEWRLRAPCASFSSHLTVATSLIQTTDQEPIWDRSRINRPNSIPE